MNILAIETSCDETAIAVLSVSGGKNPAFRLRANVVHSQIAIHAPYGGVFPALAKREHSKNLIPVLTQALKKAKLLKVEKSPKILHTQYAILNTLLKREPELLEQFLKEIPRIKKPRVGAIAVTHGPGLEPALWVGINFAKALSLVWDVPVVPVNHMEGHLFSSFIREKEFTIPASPAGRSNLQFPMLALLVSGGHTELILIKKWGSYKKVGETQDDAAGEAFDKVARMLGLPYPGGPHIAALAAMSQNNAEQTQKNAEVILPRPMIHSGDFNFSFSGLKTAVLYLLRDLSKKHSSVLQNTRITQGIAYEFQEAVVDVLVKKTIDAAKKYKTNAILLGGGVAANERLRARLSEEAARALPHVRVLLPDRAATTDNAAMIAVAGYFISQAKKKTRKTIRAQGNLSL
ncbi:MAG: tRNA (adenosine(37)-N6)-threonylcarbamoyltransferase complex transferase subunit TsaD [Patescibacteria group bacterium]